MKNITIATGFVRPKTTSLFFDKIWLPYGYKSSELGKAESLHLVPNRVCFKDKYGDSRLKEELKELKNHYHYMARKNRDYSLDLLEIKIKQIFKYSHNRNFALYAIVKYFEIVYNIDIVPIYHDKTEFERSTSINLDRFYYNRALFFKQYSNLNNDVKQEKMDSNKNENITTECNSYEVCIKGIPSMIENKLSWKQVLEMRKDKKSIKKLHRFRNWMNLELKEQSASNTIDILEKTLDDYKFALNKHGVLTTVGSITTVLSSSAVIIDMLSQNSSSIISTGFAVSAGIITFTSSQIINLIETRRSPIAYLYDIAKKT